MQDVLVDLYSQSHISKKEFMVTASHSRTAQTPSAWVNPAGLSRIVGFTCVAGFISDIAVAAMPIAIRSIQWRMNLLQQISDRGIVLLFGLSLLALSYAGKRLWNKRMGLISLIIGVFFLLSCIAFIKDSLSLQKAANTNVDTRATALQAQVQQQSENPQLQGQVTPKLIEEATQQINSQAELFKQNVKASTVRVALSALSNLLITGIAFISLGRYCIQTRRAK